MSRRTRHIREFVETLAGPMIYLGFFGLAYLAASLSCALSGGNGALVADPRRAIAVTIAGLTAVALLLLALVIVDASRRLANGREDTEDVFLGMTALALAAVSALAVLWTALPAAAALSVC